ncbi:MAG: sulfatase [Rikenellaceae bacterium]
MKRDLIKNFASGMTVVLPLALTSCSEAEIETRPNVIFVFADQLRQQALGYAGDENVQSPNIDLLAQQSLNMTNAISGCPVSSPYRASLMTGQYPLSNGIFLNDLQLNSEAQTIAKQFLAAGYNTAYVGKWHLNGNGRSNYIAPEFRQGFQYFKAIECNHNYNDSKYYDNDDTDIKTWEGYDTFAQTADAMKYISTQATQNQPFMLMLSIGTPHDPYGTAPKEYQELYADKPISLRDNVPQKSKNVATKNLKGYYAHVTALDDAIGELLAHIKELGLDKNTIFVFTADHGDMLGSHGFRAKQRPYDESIRIPFLLRYPKMFGVDGGTDDLLFNVTDVMPTLLAMCNIPIPESVEGRNVLPILLGEQRDSVEAVIIESVSPYGEFRRSNGGREYRGVRTKRYTYVRDMQGPWLLFDNDNDPYQLNNLIGNEQAAALQAELDTLLMRMLRDRGDDFLSGWDYIDKWGYRSLLDEGGTVIYTK